MSKPRNNTNPYNLLLKEVNITIIIKIIFPKIVLKRETNNSGIKYNIDHNMINIVNRPINFVLFSSFIIFFIVFFILDNCIYK